MCSKSCRFRNTPFASRPFESGAAASGRAADTNVLKCLVGLSQATLRSYLMSMWIDTQLRIARSRLFWRLRRFLGRIRFEFHKRILSNSEKYRSAKTNSKIVFAAQHKHIFIFLIRDWQRLGPAPLRDLFAFVTQPMDTVAALALGRQRQLQHVSRYHQRDGRCPTRPLLYWVDRSWQRGVFPEARRGRCSAYSCENRLADFMRDF